MPSNVVSEDYCLENVKREVDDWNWGTGRQKHLLST